MHWISNHDIHHPSAIREVEKLTQPIWPRFHDTYLTRRSWKISHKISEQFWGNHYYALP